MLGAFPLSIVQMDYIKLDELNPYNCLRIIRVTKANRVAAVSIISGMGPKYSSDGFLGQLNRFYFASSLELGQKE